MGSVSFTENPLKLRDRGLGTPFFGKKFGRGIGCCPGLPPEPLLGDWLNPEATGLAGDCVRDRGKPRDASFNRGLGG